MTFRFLLALAALLMPAHAFAQDVAGTWDFRLDETTIFRFAIAEGEDGEWTGEWSRPANFNSDGNAFTQLRGGVETIDSAAGYEFEGDVELSFDDPRPGAVPDVFRFAEGPDDTLVMTYVGTDLAPYVLVRADADAPMGGWDEAATYRRITAAPAGAPTGARLGDVDFQLNGIRTVSTRRPAQPVSEPEAAEETEDGVGEAAEDRRLGDDFLEGLPERD